MRRISALLFLLFTLCGATVAALLLASAPSALASGAAYVAGASIVDEVSGGPWNTSQGNPAAGAAYPESDLLQTFKFGGPETTLGGVSEPNVAVYPAETGSVPYPSGVAGTPGPLSGYCSKEESENETGSPISSQPNGSTLPFAPYYFPDVVRNADGSLTGYFDWRPKDADEAITVARSTNNGKTWTTEGKALEQNPGYCPTADTNDDGEGHPFVTTVNGTNTLYTLQRSAGDYEGVGLLVHSIGANNSANPLSGLSETETSGIDPNTFATAETILGTTAKNIPVTTLGSSQGPNTIVSGPYIDYSHNSPTSGSKPTIITCTGTTTSPAPPELTGCTIPSGASLTVASKDDLVQVMEEVSKAATVPAGPNEPSGESKKALEKLKFAVNSYGYADATSNSNALAWLMNNNAPNRVYVDGHAVYCFTTNTNPITTNLQFCSSPSGAFSVAVGDPITGDPITPASAQMTTGLIAPDGIVGTVPYTSTFNGRSVPSNATVMLYTEKIVNYFVEGELNGPLNAEGTTYTPSTVSQPTFTLPGSGTTAFGLNFQPFPGTREPLPASGSFTIYTSTSGGTSIVPITCAGWSASVPANAPAGSVDVTGCSSGTATGLIDATGSSNTKIGEGTGYWIGGPNAAVIPYSVLNKIGEGKNGKTSGPGRLFGNNEDYTVLRAAFTENGVDFTDLGPISGTSSGTGSTNGSYTDLANSLQQNSPENSANPNVGTTTPTAPTNLSAGSADTVELRYIGSRGTIVTNPDGSLGMFLSGSWPTDGDSDAFNQIFYSSSTNDGQTWSVPTVVLSTEYEFKASREQDEALAHNENLALGISAYYSGRAYGPAVVQNPNGTLTMVFSGYRLPKPITAAGTVLGINAAAQYAIGSKDPAVYRNILTTQLLPATSTVVSSSDGGSGVVGAPVTYTATVSVNPPNTGTPTGTVSFTDEAGPIAGCTGQSLSATAPDTATCTTQHAASIGSDQIKAVYSGDSTHAESASLEYTEATTQAATSTAVSSSDVGTGLIGAPVTYTATVAVTSPGAGTPTGSVAFSDNYGPISGCSSEPLSASSPYTATCATTHEHPSSDQITATYTGDLNFTGSSGSSSEFVEEAPAITSNNNTTFTEGTTGSFTVTTTGAPAPNITETGTLPAGVELTAGVLSGDPTEEGTFRITLEASNGVGSPAVQSFTLTADAAPVITSPSSATFSESATGSFTPAASGTPAPTIEESGTLPNGVKFTDGTLSGRPTQEGEFMVTFEASNGVGSPALQIFTLTVDAAPAITSANEVTFNDQSASSFTVTATGTPAPAITESGSLPTGVSFDRSTGVLSGTPTQLGTFQIAFTATNGIGAPSVQQFKLTVAGLHITTTSPPPNVSPGVPYSHQLAATGGLTPFKWKVSTGNLPVGLKLNATTGLLSGTVGVHRYPNGHSFPFTVTVTDSTKKVHQTATATFTIVVPS